MTPTPHEDMMTEQTEQEPKAPCVHCGRTDWRWTGECWFDDPAAGPPSYRRVEIRCDWCKPLRMDAYYFGFGGTGVELVDRILSAVAMAGKGYHHTESWGDEGQEDWGPFRGGDYVSWIQNAASDVAALLREQDAQIARLSAQVEEQRSFKILMIKDATRLEVARDEARSEAATLRAERDAAQQREVEANNYFRMSQSNYDEAMRQLRAAQQQIATLTQELSVSRANHIDANQRNMQSVRELEAAEARCATLQGAVAADEERLRQAAARAGVLFVGCDTADVLADRCATLTAALEQLRDCDWTIGRGDRMDAVRDIARNALSGVPTP